MAFRTAFFFSVSLLAAAAFALPVAADERRHCDATIILQPTDPQLNGLSYAFRVESTAPSIFLVNRIREWISEDIVDCVRAHWDQRMTRERPGRCESLGDLGDTRFYGYPFTALYDEMTEALCDANRGQAHFNIDFELQIRGEPRCVHRQNDNGVDPMDWYVIAVDYRITCPQLPGDGGMSQNTRPPAGEGSASENYEPPGAGGSGSGSPPPLPEPAGAEFSNLANVRLPGHDIAVVDVGDGGWQACRALCLANDTCAAFTWRNRYQGRASVCLLKGAAGATIPDACCHSGIRQ